MKAVVVAARAAELFEEQRVSMARRVDRSFALLMLGQYAAAVVTAIWISPTTWAGARSATHPHVWAAVLIGLVITSFPVALARFRPGEVVTRHVVAIGQMLMSALLIHITGGRLETHFHVFGSLAFLAFYRDWKVLVTASIVVALDHGLRGVFWPQSVFGTAASEHWRWMEHTGWVMFENVFLALSIEQSLGTLREMTLQRAELEAARDESEQANRAKDNFIAVLSHELRTPLTPCLMTLSGLANDERVAPDVRDELNMVRRNVELEARLIDDLLDLTRIAQGKIQLVTAPADLHALLQHIVETCRGELEAKGLTAECVFTAGRFWVNGDSARLQQVFWNLIKNAVKFTPSGGRIEVTTRNEGGRLRVEVTDNGIGIPAEVLPRLFERFQQGGAAITRQFGGLGLGLSISRAIVELHRGTVRAESRGRGWGATFSVVLPTVAAPAQPGPASSESQVLRLHGKLPRKVLLVDDHADTRRTLAKMLDRAGYLVTTAESVGDALEKAAAARFDLLVSDIGLPDGSGHDLMHALRERYHLRGIAFSGFGMETDVQKSLAAGFAAHLTKPIDFERLKQTMAAALAGPPPPKVRVTAA